MSSDVAQLYEEILRLEREQQETDRRIKEIETKERRGLDNSTRRRKRNRNTFEEPGTQGNNNNLDTVDSTKDLPSDSIKNSKDYSREKLRNSRDSRRENTEDSASQQNKRFRSLRDDDVAGTRESDNKRLASAVVSGESSRERQTPALPDEVMARNRKMFSVLLGTLNTFKESLHNQEQTETARRRKEIEAKVQSKVMQEHEQILEQQRRELQNEKARQLARREELERLLTEKELALWKITWEQNATQRSRFMKTQTSPAVYFSFAKYDDFTREIYKKYTGHEWTETTTTSTSQSEITETKEPTTTTTTTTTTITNNTNNNDNDNKSDEKKGDEETLREHEKETTTTTTTTTIEDDNKDESDTQKQVEKEHDSTMNAVVESSEQP